MKKKSAHKRKTHRHTSHSSGKRLSRNEGTYVVLVRSWVFLVLFAIMLGVGMIAGNYLNAQLNGSPMVAGASTSR